MRNIFTLPAGRLAEFEGQYFIEEKHQENFKSYDTYITSDEDVKKGDWFYSRRGLIEKARKSFSKKEAKKRGCTLHKVILTDNQDLIKDDVQAVDDEFLEWFIKNPSCEWIGVDQEFNPKNIVYGINMSPYKIIIPKEEPFIEYTNTNDCTSMIYNSKEKPKQETLGDDDGIEWDFDKLLKETETRNFSTTEEVFGNETIEEAAKRYEKGLDKNSKEDFINGVKSNAAKNYWFKIFKNEQDEK